MGSDEAQAFERGRRPLVRAAFHIEVDAGIHQENLDILGAVRKQVQLNVGVLGRRAVQHGADQMRIELGEPCHEIGRSAPQVREQAGMGVRGEELQMTPQLVLDLRIVRHRPARVRPIAKQLAHGATLRLRVVATLIGDETGCRGGNLGAQAIRADRHDKVGV